MSSKNKQAKRDADQAAQKAIKRPAQEVVQQADQQAVKRPAQQAVQQADQQADQQSAQLPVIRTCIGCGCSFEDKNGPYYDGIDGGHCSNWCYDNTR